MKKKGNVVASLPCLIHDASTLVSICMLGHKIAQGIFDFLEYESGPLKAKPRMSFYHSVMFESETGA